MAFVSEPMLSGDLYDSAAKLGRAANAELLRLADPAARVDAGARWWTEVVALGWPILAIPEACGGVGGSVEDVASLVEGAASDALLLPVAAICGVLPLVLAAASPDRVGALAAGIAEGSARLCPVLEAYHGWAPAADRPRAVQAPDGSLRLYGTALGVEILAAPTGYVLACPVADALGHEQPGLILVPASVLPAPFRYERMDGRLSADLSFTATALPADALLARGAAVADQVKAALELGALLTCVEVVSALGAALGCVITYLSERKQFGVALSSLQALRHKVAETYITYEMLKALVQHVLRTAGQGGGPASRDVALAKLHVGRSARKAAETIIQLHGGMGMTQELPATRMNKRLLMAEFDYGDAAWHARQLLRAA